ncbi:hypothetical protein GG344DRAFT_67397 [Lentinula edodes]|nr:hypothetical protein GG344DRAFT_67397 [Lentinula edodes]
MDKDNDDDYPLDYDDGTDDGGTDELVDSQPLQDDDTDNNRSQTVPEEDFQISTDYDHEPSSAIAPTAFLSDPAALASRMLQLSGALRRRAQPSRVTTNPSPPSSLLPVPSSRRSLANQSAESFSSAGGISNAPSPSRLQPPPFGATTEAISWEGNEFEPDSPGGGQHTLHHQELLQASAAERTQMEARLMGSLQDDIRGITRSELKLLESNLQQKLTSLLPMEAINRLLSSLENTFTHLYDPAPPTQGLPTSTPPPEWLSVQYEAHQSSKLPSTPPKPIPPSQQQHTPRISSTTQLPSLLTRLQDGPSASQPETVSFDSKRSMIKAGKRRAMEHEEDSRDSKRRSYNSRTAHSVSVFLPSEWDPLPFTIDRIFTMYYRWSSDFDAAVHVTLPRVGFITRIGGDRLKLSFSPEGLEEFLRAWNTYHNVVPGLANVVVCRDNAD